MARARQHVGGGVSAGRGQSYAPGGFQGLHSRGASAKMPFEFPIHVPRPRTPLLVDGYGGSHAVITPLGRPSASTTVADQDRATAFYPSWHTTMDKTLFVLRSRERRDESDESDVKLSSWSVS